MGGRITTDSQGVGRSPLQQVTDDKLGKFMLLHGIHEDVDIENIFVHLTSRTADRSNRDQQRYISSYIGRFNKRFAGRYKIIVGEARRTYRIVPVR